MQHEGGSLIRKGILKTVLIFVISYLIFLFLWIGIKDIYGYLITSTASRVLELLKDVQVESIKPDDGRYLVTLVPERFRAVVSLEVPVKTSTYTFNAPLTFAIMVSFFLPLWERFRPSKRYVLRVYIEALCLLMFVHLLFVFSLEGERLTGVMMNSGYEEFSAFKLGFWQFLWGFVDNMVIRFEPFLIGAYLYFRRR